MWRTVSSVVTIFVLCVYFSFFTHPDVEASQTIYSNTVVTCTGESCTTKNDTGHPVPPSSPADLRQAIIDKFGITMNGYNHQQLEWAWEKFWDVSNTQAMELARGTRINAVPGYLSQQLGCKAVNFGNAYTTKIAMVVTLLHELGHIIYWCNPDSVSRRTEMNSVFRAEGGMTGYSRSPCWGTPPVTEDYAEMITYYLNPDIREQTPCHNTGRVPFANNSYPLHYNLAKSILGVY